MATKAQRVRSGYVSQRRLLVKGTLLLLGTTLKRQPTFRGAVRLKFKRLQISTLPLLLMPVRERGALRNPLAHLGREFQVAALLIRAAALLL